MAILIKGLKMQDTCYECPFNGYEFGECFADVDQRYTEGFGNISPFGWNKLLDYGKMQIIKRYGHGPGKPEWCQLIEVTEFKVKE